MSDRLPVRSRISRLPARLKTLVNRALPVGSATGLPDAAKPPALGSSREVNRLIRVAQGALERQAEMRDTAERLNNQVEVVSKRLRKIENAMLAILRRELDAASGADIDPLDLDAQRFGVLSQNEEDGYVVALLKQCGAPNRTFVELGSGRTGGNSGLLAQSAGWRGLMVEANPRSAEVAAARFGQTGKVVVISDFVTPENVDGLISGANLAGDIDLFSLDIDSFDYWVFRAMTVARPRVAILEYNDRFGPSLRVTVPSDTHRLDRSRMYFGASLAALTALSAEKGYRLVGCDMSGTNAFFVREDLASDLPTVTPEAAWRENPRRSGTSSGAARLAELKAAGLDLVEV